MDGDKVNGNSVNQSSEKLLIILEYLAEQAEPVRLLEIAKCTGINASTVTRFLAVLLAHGYAEKEETTGRYRLTARLLHLADKVKVKKDLRHICMPYMRVLTRTLSCTCNLVVEYEMSALYVEVIGVPGQAPEHLQHIGGVAPLHCTGAGKIFMTDFDENQTERYQALRGLKKMTEHTITDPALLKKELRKIKTQGYAIDNEECEPGIRCIAAPLYDFSNRIVAAISINGPVSMITDTFIRDQLLYVTDTAKLISSHLGQDIE